MSDRAHSFSLGFARRSSSRRVRAAPPTAETMIMRNGGVFRRLRTVVGALASAVALLVVAGCSQRLDDVLPRVWLSVDNPHSEDYPIGIVLMPDGTGAVRNWPMWDGAEACTLESFTLYDGIVAWREEGDVPVIWAPAGDVEVLPAVRFGQDWDKLVLNFCGEDSPNVIFFGGVLEDDEGVDVLDTLDHVDWEHLE